MTDIEIGIAIMIGIVDGEDATDDSLGRFAFFQRIKLPKRLKLYILHRRRLLSRHEYQPTIYGSRT